MNENAIKDRLKIIAKDKNVTFNEVWKQLLLERFLARLSKSQHNEKFIFKGGLLLAQYLTIGRETMDIDFLITKIKADIPIIKAAMNEIATISLEDGFIFTLSSVEELSQPHMEYGGFRIKFNAELGKMKDTIQVDLGVGDVVNPKVNKFHPFEYRGKPIFEGEISLLMYPVETIFAEKLETVISKGSINSRMKDYHDIILMLRETDLLNIPKLKKTIKDTFEHRKTKLEIPIQFDQIGTKKLQSLWTSHLKGLGNFVDKLNLPKNITEVLKEINEWININIIQ